MIRSIDLNADLGESFGHWQLGDDDAVLALVSSANIACGFHAGDPLVMQQTVQRCRQHGVAIGAHPALPDLQGFGRRLMQVSAAEAYAFCVYQIGALQGFARAVGCTVRHVKPHGALYNMAMRDPALAQAIAQATRDSAVTTLVGLPGSALHQAAHPLQLNFCAEGFADRRFQDDGSLLPRTAADAVITDAGQAIAQALQMVLHGTVTTTSGATLAVELDTLCVHGDGDAAVQLLTRLRQALIAHGLEIGCTE